MTDFFYKLMDGKSVTQEEIMREALTHLGGSLYAYMVMLEVSDRKIEAKRMEDFRTRIFKIRDNMYSSIVGRRTSTPEEDCADMASIYKEMKVVSEMLVQYRPGGESMIFQSPLNDACGLAYRLKEFYKNNPAPKE